LTISVTWICIICQLSGVILQAGRHMDGRVIHHQLEDQRVHTVVKLATDLPGVLRLHADQTDAGLQQDNDVHVCHTFCSKQDNAHITHSI
jgi:hypothetical protein